MTPSDNFSSAWRRRAAVALAAALSLWVVLAAAGGFTRSELLHIILSLVWLLDFLLFKRHLFRSHWPVIVLVSVLGTVCSWYFLEIREAEVGGVTRPVELLWWLLFILSLAVLYRLLCRALVALISLSPRLRELLIAPRGWWLRFARMVVALLLFVPYMYVATNTHRTKSGNGTNPLRAKGLRYETVYFRSAEDNVALSGWFIPAEHSHNTVLLCHGLGANKGNFLGFVPFLHRAGFNVFLFDFRAHGDSGGHTTSFGYYEARDVRGAMRYLKTRPDCKNIAACAFSMGGSALLHAIPDLPELRGSVVDSSFADMTEVARDQMFFLPEPAWSVVHASVDAATRFELGVSLHDISPRRRIGVLSPRPLLLIHGSADGLIPVAQARENLVAAGAPKELWIVLGARHVGAFALDEKRYVRKVTAFLKRCLK